ncbi:DsbA family protein [Aurantimonas sp. A2-1-M11]|uniref:DsbA family protein n=1 Tax=Aurantimonas sp. A2-1-M11 TaxID=3113712 RepID=UPI003FA5741A
MVGGAAAQDVTPAPAQTSFDATQTDAIETIVRSYLIEHPEVLLEALDALEAKRESAQAAAQKAAIADAGPALFESPEGTVLGNPEGDITVVEFFDYNCGYCKQAMQDMDALIASDPNIRFVLKEIPVLGPQSHEAARVSLAFREIAPTRYGEFHRQLLGSRGTADEASAIALAKDLGVDEAALREAMTSDAVADALQESNDLATGLGINGTPSYVISRELVPGAVGLDNLTASIANVRECGSIAC